MIAVDFSMVALGALLGVVVGTGFFAGLACGMRIALRRAHPGPVLLASAGLRIALLLAVGVWVAGQGATMLAGFALGFLAARLCILAIARRPDGKGASWN